MGRPTQGPTRSVTTAAGFEGAAGRLAAIVMARLNRDMERAAVAELNPPPDVDVLAIGFGPGVGIKELLPRLERGCIAGIDPSATMVEQARRRNRDAVDSGQVVLVEATADAIPFPDGAFGGVVAVNSVQLWRPLERSLHEVERVLAPGGSLVTVTHVWAIQKQAPLDEWLARATSLLGSSGLEQLRHRTSRFRSGAGLVLSAHKPRFRNHIAP